MGSNNKALLTQVVQDAVLKLCTQHITFDTQLEIDGIICVSPGKMVPEIVIKMHRTIMKPEEPVQAQWADITGSDVYTGSPQATHTQSQRSRNRSSQIRGSPQQPSPRHDPPHSKRRLDNQPQLEQYAVPDSMPQTGMNIKSEPTYLDSQTPSGSVGSGDSNTGDGAIVYGVPSGSAKKRKPPELDTTSVANKIIKTEDPILIEEDMTTATDQAYMGGNNSAMAEQGMKEAELWRESYHTNPQGQVQLTNPDHQENYQQQRLPGMWGDTHGNSGLSGSYDDNQSYMKMPSKGQLRIYRSTRDIPEPVEVDRDINCEKCGITFPSIRCLDNHNMIVHNKFCDVCSKRLDDESVENLLQHGKMHTGMKPFQCEYCYKLINTKAGLKFHQDKNLRCLICSQEFMKTHKSNHMKTHLI